MDIFYILEWFLVIISFITFGVLSLWIFSSFNKKTRFTQTPSSVFKYISKSLEIKEGSAVYHLGCGDGRVLFNLAKQKPKAEFIGVEDNKFFLGLAFLHNWWNKIKKKEKIEIINRDFFNQDLSKATHIFVYLYPNFMDDLLSKFDKELSPGTRLVSLNFHFTSKQPIAEISLPKKSYQRNHRIYVYEF